MQCGLGSVGKDPNLFLNADLMTEVCERAVVLQVKRGGRVFVS